MFIEHVDTIIDMRRFQTMEAGATPGNGPHVLESLIQTDTVSGKLPGERLVWAADLSLARAQVMKSFDVLLWIGEAGFEQRGQRTLRSLVRLLRAAEVDFAVLGEEERDVGDTARRLGDEATFRRLAQDNVTTLSKYRFNRIVTADPHVLHCLLNEYPEFGGRYVVVHHTEFLASLIEVGALPVSGSSLGAVTYHDPCYLGRYNSIYDAPRKVLKAGGFDIKEMHRSRERSFCCGAGGGASITDIESRERIPDLRMRQAHDTGAATVAVACPNCAVMLEGATNRRANVADVAELLDRALMLAAEPASPLAAP